MVTYSATLSTTCRNIAQRTQSLTPHPSSTALLMLYAVIRHYAQKQWRHTTCSALTSSRRICSVFSTNGTASAMT